MIFLKFKIKIILSGYSALASQKACLITFEGNTFNVEVIL